MNNAHENYRKQREILLQNLTERLSASDQFVAAWLTGSFARGQQDTLSDLDLTLVVADEYYQTLCARPWMVSAQTTPERYDLFRWFGRPAFLHENNHNAPEGGTFTFVAYAENAMMVDWILRPTKGTQRPAEVRLLFDKGNLPIQASPEAKSQAQRTEEASEIMAFFWMMAAVTVKYISRGDSVFVNTWLEELTKLVAEVAQRLEGQGRPYQRGSHLALKTTRDEQVATLHKLCQRMESLRPEIARRGGHVAEAPMTLIETLISLA